MLDERQTVGTFIVINNVKCKLTIKKDERKKRRKGF